VVSRTDAPGSDRIDKVNAVLNWPCNAGRSRLARLQDDSHQRGIAGRQVQARIRQRDVFQRNVIWRAVRFGKRIRYDNPVAEGRASCAFDTRGALSVASSVCTTGGRRASDILNHDNARPTLNAGQRRRARRAPAAIGIGNIGRQGAGSDCRARERPHDRSTLPSQMRGLTAAQINRKRTSSTGDCNGEISRCAHANRRRGR